MDEAGQEITTIPPEEEKKLGFDDFKEALKENPDLPVSYQTLLPYVNDPEFFERFIRDGSRTGCFYDFRSKLYQSEGGLINLIREKKETFSEYLYSRYATLDEFSRDFALNSALGVKQNMNSLVTICVKEGFFSGEIPYGHTNFRKYQPSYYFSPKVVGGGDIEKGEEIVMKNLGRFARYEFKNPDEIYKSRHTQMFASALGIHKSVKAIAAACIKHNFFSPEIPDLHPISKGGHRSFYFDEEVVGGGDIEKGRRIVEENKKRAVHYLFSSVEDVSKRFRSWWGLCTIFNVPIKITKLRRAIAETNWLGGEWREWISSEMPERFKEQERKATRVMQKINKLRKKGKEVNEVGMRTEDKLANNNVCVKGDAFEQLVGLYLAFVHSDEIIYPQYCLDVGEKHYRTRVDFKAGKELYEVKWGRALENISATEAKHKKLLKKEQNRSLNYHLVRLYEKEEWHENFNELVSEIEDDEMRGEFEVFAALLDVAGDPEKKEDVERIRLLRNVRDYLYNVADKTNTIKGKERQKYIRDVLAKLNSFGEDFEGLSNYSRQNTRRHLSPLEATFFADGEYYRGRISTPEYIKEQKERYIEVYFFGNIDFVNMNDRDLAVMIELFTMPYGEKHSEFWKKALKEPNVLQKKPLFKLPDGTILSTHPNPKAIQVKNLVEAKELFRKKGYFEEMGQTEAEELWNFATEYLKVLGQEA